MEQKPKSLSLYNFAIVGAGASGLWLANSMHNNGLLKDKTLCIIENDKDKINDRTWCYWANNPIGDQEVVSKKWSSINNIYRENDNRILPYQYYHVKSQDFYENIKTRLRKNPNVFWKHDALVAISHLSETNLGVELAHESFITQYIFLSALPTLNKIAEEQKLNHYLGKQELGKPLFIWQSFVGYRIKTSTPVFNPEELTMMDFNTPQDGFTQFFYELPFSENEALVEFTRFGIEKLDFNYAIKQIENRLNIKNIAYEILEVEKGAIPMTSKYDILKTTLPTNQNVVYIGALAGALKPSTGYGYKRMFHYAENLAAALKKNGKLSLPTMKRKWRFRLYDILLLQILQDSPDLGKKVFEALFKNQPINRILKFLDEDTTISEEILIFCKLPIFPFLRSLVKYSLGK